jgi:hypothetical protein
MDFARVELLFKHPAVRLLRADHGAFALAFLRETFREGGQPSVSAELLRTRLQRWLEERRAAETRFEWERSAQEYLDEWCAEDRAWLRKAHAGDLEPAYELTPATETAISWLDQLTGAAFVGTESRLENIFRELDELLRQASGDAEARLEHLRAERERIDAEITKILTTGEVSTFEPWQVNERYAGLLEMARTLVGDFRQVEENFRRIAQDVVERQAAAGSTKGEIVGRMLDSHDGVRDSPQGRSFYGFVRLLLDPDQREHFEAQVERIAALDLLAPELRDDPLLRRLLPRLRGEQEKVGNSAQRLTSNLRRALETARLTERRRVRELVGEIRALALRVREAPPPRADFFEIEDLPEVWPGGSRPLWDEDAAIALDGGLDAGAAELDWEALSRLRNLPHLAIAELRANVEACLAERDFVLLTEVLARFPVAQGIMEIIGYLIVAAQPPHYFARNQWDEIAGGDFGRWRVPRVVFNRPMAATA